MDNKEQDVIKLCYTIHKYSSYSAEYMPENIMVNNPEDQHSRWFTDSTTPSQYITLKLNSPSIVHSIKFGKYIKSHVSDLKKFDVFGGMEESNLSLLLSAGLKGSCNQPETFKLRYRTQEGLYLPILYLKISPVQSWGPAYNYTIWYVELHGINDSDIVRTALDTVNLRKEEEAVRILLKHLRKQHYTEAFEALSKESGVKLEGPVQERLWEALVENGDYKLAEKTFKESIDEGEIDYYMSWQPYIPTWKLLSPCSPQVEAKLKKADAADATSPSESPDSNPDRDSIPTEMTNGDRASSPGGEWQASPLPSSPVPGGPEGPVCPAGPAPDPDSRPGPRGGHQLVVDCSTGILYLYGGWNGLEDLDDLWSFDPSTECWKLLCLHSHLENGPSPRSCHKMVFEPTSRRLYTLGRYLDSVQRVANNMNSDFYMYDIDCGAWSLVCRDTRTVGGPSLVFDHQMCVDAQAQTIYVFGGRIFPVNSRSNPSPSLPQYSGLYSYRLSRRGGGGGGGGGVWAQLLADQHELYAPPSRVSHSMLFHPVQRRLYMFLGQRNREQLLDLWWFDVETHESGALCRARAACAAPAAGFTQRATLDARRDEIYVLSGMSKDKDKCVYNTLWVFSLRLSRWTCVYRTSQPGARPTCLEPRPRYAHQLVYDSVRKIHYLFGGNPGSQSNNKLRLDDLWGLTLSRPTFDKVWKTTRADIRETCFREMVTKRDNEIAALEYLRTEVYNALDHDEPEEVSRFQKLTTLIFSGASLETQHGAALTPATLSTLCRRRAALAAALTAVLGADDQVPDLSDPFAPFSPPSPPPEPQNPRAPCPHAPLPACPDPHYWRIRHHRSQLYERLCRYYRPGAVPPKADVMDLVML